MKPIALKVRFFNGYAMRKRRAGVGVIGGTHKRVDPKVAPKNTLLIERMKDPRDHRYLLAHECLEHLIMRLKRWSYPRAHTVATRLELALRRGANPESTIRRFCVRYLGEKRGRLCAGPLTKAFRAL